MANGKPWTEKEMQTVIKMREEKRTYEEIAKALKRTKKALNAFINRCNEKEEVIPRRKRTAIGFAEYEKRKKCNDLGMTDRESADECNVSAATYAHWRMKEKLPCNPEKKVLEKVLVKEEYKPARKLEPEDVINYRHNTYTAPINNYSGPVTIIVDKELAEKELDRLGIKPKAKLSESPIFVIGSKWTDPDSYITAPKNCRDRMRNHG